MYESKIGSGYLPLCQSEGRIYKLPANHPVLKTLLPAKRSQKIRHPLPILLQAGTVFPRLSHASCAWVFRVELFICHSHLWQTPPACRVAFSAENAPASGLSGLSEHETDPCHRFPYTGHSANIDLRNTVSRSPVSHNSFIYNMEWVEARTFTGQPPLRLSGHVSAH